MGSAARVFSTLSPSGGRGIRMGSAARVFSTLSPAAGERVG